MGSDDFFAVRKAIRHFLKVTIVAETSKIGFEAVIDGM
jgi:hypothetical protein